MPNPIVVIDARRIHNERTFHSVFAKALGFPDFYGKNMAAWVDCMTSLDSPGDGMTKIHAPAGGVLVLQIDHVEDFARRCPQLFATLISSAGFVNWRKIEQGEDAVLALSFYS